MISRAKPRSAQRPAASGPVAAATARVERLDGRRLATALLDDGYALTPALLTPADCRALIALYADDRRFRSRVDMGRHRFGQGDYAYFGAPLPPLVAALRRALYAQLAPIASEMARALGDPQRFPAELEAYTRACHRAGQRRPTPLLLRYEAGGYNRLHRDLYGEMAFPLQATILLSRPRIDFEGGEFLLVEDRPRQQARGDAIALEQGAAVIFPVRDRPVRSGERFTRARMRHGVSRIRTGERYTLGIIFHDAA